MPLAQREQALQMLAQLRLLDPSASAEIGTPERKIIDTVAGAVADNAIDITLLQGQLDFNAKFGDNLDRFFSLFRFNRQAAAFAEGFVRFGRLVASNADIRIPSGSRVMAPILETSPEGVTDALEAGNTVFQTTLDVYLRAGETSVLAPIRAVAAGSTGNVAAGRITTFVGEPVIGITTVTNEQPTTGGLDRESDNEYKTRFKNTVFRNVAGTQDQYLALSLALAFTSKANVVGPISRYREYIQVPSVADNAQYVSGGVDYGVGNGNAGEYSTALSTLPYAKHIWHDVPHFVSNGELGPTAIFYRHETDFRLNTTPFEKNRGDAFRLFANVSPPVDDDPLNSPGRPSVTFTNVYTGSTADVEAIRPGDVVLVEYSYLSDASRNDYERRIMNCIDVFINGQNPTLASTVIPRPTVAHLFIDNIDSKFHYDNYRRQGEGEHRPVLGNVLTPLFFQPTIDIPESFEIEDGSETYTFIRNVHYWLVEDVSEYAGTIRARNGIEWSLGVGSKMDSDDDAGPYTGPYVTELSADATIQIDNYSYDRNIVDLQGSLETNKQVTPDVLAHRARTRYFKLDISMMYDQGGSVAAANQGVYNAVADYFDTQVFGGIVQLSDLLQAIHGAAGVDNVRWSSDVPHQPDTFRVQECDILGQPLANVIIDRRQQAQADRGVSEVQQMYITGSPESGTFKLAYGLNESLALAYNINAASLLTQLNTLTGGNVASVTGTGSYGDPFVITFVGTGSRSLLESFDINFLGGPYIFETDFILKDDELPALPLGELPTDTAPGLIIRPRAQQTWSRL